MGQGTGLRAEYFSNLTLSGAAALVRTEAIAFDWGTAAPAAALPANSFSVRWTGEVQAPVSGEYRFETLSDDGVRVWVNGALVIDNWNDHLPSVDTSAAIAMTAGERYSIRVEYYERNNNATMHLRWLVPGSSTASPVPADRLFAFDPLAARKGLRGEYFPNMELLGPPVLYRDEAINFNWALGAPAAPGMRSDGFSVRWTGKLKAPSTGVYTFLTQSDDGVRVWIDGALVIDNWTAHPVAIDTSPAMSLTAGQQYDIRVEYFDRGAHAVIQLYWSLPGTGQYSPVLADVLSPP